MIASAVLAGCLHVADRGMGRTGGHAEAWVISLADADSSSGPTQALPAAPASAPGDSAAPPSAPVRRPSETTASTTSSEAEAGGTHFRVETPRGPVHVFRPPGYHRATAGVVIYVHGYYVNVDQAWHEHGLGEQFAASRRNALFIVPEAPQSGTENSPWTRLSTLVARACRGARLQVPPGPWVVVGHSAAYRTIVRWLKEPEIRHVVLVDALYGNEASFRRWLDGTRAHKMTMIVKGTTKWAEPFAASLPYTVRAPRVPAELGELSPAARSAKLLYLSSQIGHFELITERKVLPVILGRTGLPAVRKTTPPAR